MTPHNPTSTNQESCEYWTGEAGRRWVAARDRYDANLAPFADRVIDAAAVSEGDRVVDVGCGTGALTRAIAAIGAPAIGMDISATMIEAARTLTDGDNPRFVVGDVQTASLSEVEPVDLVVSRFGVMFFADPTAAFANLRSTGARLAFACWQSATDNEWVVVPTGVIIDVLGALPSPPERDSPGPFSLADPDRITTILGDAGWRDVTIERFEPDILLGGPGSTTDAAEFATSGGPASRLLVDQPDDVIAEIRDRMEQRLAVHYDAEAGGVRLGTRTWIVTATP